MKSLLQLNLLLYASVLSAQSYLPTSTTGQIVEHTYFTLSYSDTHEQAEWVYYKLTPELINGTISRTDNFRPDHKVSSGSAQLDDYKGSGYDRGHLCPAGDMKMTQRGGITFSCLLVMLIAGVKTQCKRQAEAGSRYCWQHKK